MNEAFRSALIIVFFISSISMVYDAGKYSEGYNETRKGKKWMVYSLCQAVFDLFMVWFLLTT